MGDRVKQFIYSPSDAGLTEWPSGTLRLEGAEVTTDPNEADVFVVPGCMSIFKDDLGRVDRLPYMAGREERHVLFDVSDHFTKALNRKWIIIRCDARDWMLRDDPNTINFAWPVGDCGDAIALPEGGFKYDVTFRGWLSTDTRRASSDACRNHPSLKCDIVQYDCFTGYIGTVGRPEYDQAKFSRLMDEFKTGMRESRIALCPESISGVFPYRFFEAMSAGRVPLLIGSDFVFPWADEIPYNNFIIRLARQDAGSAAEAIQFVKDTVSDDDLIEMGKQARKYWELYLNSQNWATLMTAAVEKKLAQMGVECPTS
jgi:hypothetical protein